MKIGGSYPEIAAQEKVVDGFVELVKRDQLDENILTEALEKSISYFNTMYPVLLGSETRQNHNLLISDNVKVLSSACDGFNIDAMVVRNLIEVNLQACLSVEVEVLTVQPFSLRTSETSAC